MVAQSQSVSLLPSITVYSSPSDSISRPLPYQNQTKPNQTKPNQTKPNQTKRNETKRKHGCNFAASPPSTSIRSAFKNEDSAGVEGFSSLVPELARIMKFVDSEMSAVVGYMKNDDVKEKENKDESCRGEGKDEEGGESNCERVDQERGEAQSSNILPWLKSSERVCKGFSTDDDDNSEADADVDADADADAGGNNSDGTTTTAATTENSGSGAKATDSNAEIADRLKYLAPMIDRLGRLLTDSASHMSQLSDSLALHSSKREESESEEIGGEDGLGEGKESVKGKEDEQDEKEEREEKREDIGTDGSKSDDDVEGDGDGEGDNEDDISTTSSDDLFSSPLPQPLSTSAPPAFSLPTSNSLNLSPPPTFSQNVAPSPPFPHLHSLINTSPSPANSPATSTILTTAIREATATAAGGSASGDTDERPRSSAAGTLLASYLLGGATAGNIDIHIHAIVSPTATVGDSNNIMSERSRSGEEDAGGQGAGSYSNLLQGNWDSDRDLGIEVSDRGDSELYSDRNIGEAFEGEEQEAEVETEAQRDEEEEHEEEEEQQEGDEREEKCDDRLRGVQADGENDEGETDDAVRNCALKGGSSEAFQDTTAREMERLPVNGGSEDSRKRKKSVSMLGKLLKRTLGRKDKTEKPEKSDKAQRKVKNA